MRHLIVLCWTSALAMTAILFMVGQLLVADSIVVHWVGNFNPALQSFAHLLTTWLEQHPQISVRTTQNVLFYYFCIWLMRAGIFALGMSIPLLITRDLASNAIIIYSSKAVSRGDYLLGKFATACGLMVLTWLGPVSARGSWATCLRRIGDSSGTHGRRRPHIDFRRCQHGRVECAGSGRLGDVEQGEIHRSSVVYVVDFWGGVGPHRDANRTLAQAFEFQLQPGPTGISSLSACQRHKNCPG